MLFFINHVLRAKFGYQRTSYRRDLESLHVLKAKFSWKVNLECLTNSTEGFGLGIPLDNLKIYSTSHKHGLLEG